MSTRAAHESSVELVVNTESLAPPLTGIGLYTRHLVDEYLTLVGAGNVHCFHRGRLLDGREVLARTDAPSDESLRRRERRMALLHRVASHTTLPYHLHQHRTRRAFARATRPLPGGTVYHEPNYILKPYTGPSVATVHDLSVFHYPQFHPKSRVRHLERCLPRSLARADRIITDSEVVRSELVERFGTPASRITAIHLGVSNQFVPASAQEANKVLTRYDLEEARYLFCVSTFEPRKNLAGLLDAFLMLPRQQRERFPLVLVGSRGWLSGEMETRLGRLADRGQVRRLGYVPRGDLPALYSGARLFAFPSLYEGFGLPVLEAMACGTPVVTSRGTSMEEITGGCAELVTPGDVDELSRAISRLLEDAQQGAAMASSGLERAAEFTWRRCAERHLAVFRDAAATA